MEEYIDVNNSGNKYEKARLKFLADDSVSQRNRDLLQQFLRDCALGKTNPLSAKKRLGPARMHAYLNYLRLVIRALDKDLDQVNQTDLEIFVEALDNGRIASQRPILRGKHGWIPSGGQLSKSYRASVKQGIKKFYKWLLGNNRSYPEMVEWIETWEPWREIPSLTATEVERMIDRCKTAKEKALIQLLFDGGFRIGELLNVRLCHVSLVRWNKDDPNVTAFTLRVPYSKTLPRTVVLPMAASAKWLQAWFEDHPQHPKLNKEGLLEAQNVQVQLFPMPAKRARAILSRIGQRALQKHVYPHLMRHTSATYWCNRLPQFKLARRFGWSLTSRMVNRYVDREGIDEMDVARIYNQAMPKEKPTQDHKQKELQAAASDDSIA